MIHLDTVVLVLAHGGQGQSIPPPVRARIDDDAVVVSPVVELELTYLHELGRISSTSEAILDAARAAWGLSMSVAPFAAVVRVADGLSWTRDPFDRLIVAQAISDGADLATRDRCIRAHHDGAIWQ